MAKKLKQEKYLNQEVKNQNSVKIKAPIVEALKTAYENPTYHFHIPGHTKGKAIFKQMIVIIDANKATTPVIIPIIFFIFFLLFSF